MTSSTERTVSTEEVKRFAEEMAQELGLTSLLKMESWSNPSLRGLHLPDSTCKLRNNQLRLRTGVSRAH